MKAGSYQDYFEALGQRESGGRYNIENSFGNLGKYQMGELALVDVGFYRSDGTARNDWIGAWTGKSGIDSKAEFLSSPSAQDAAVEAYAAKIWSYIRSFDLDAYAGQTLNG